MIKDALCVCLTCCVMQLTVLFISPFPCCLSFELPANDQSSIIIILQQLCTRTQNSNQGQSPIPLENKSHYPTPVNAVCLVHFRAVHNPPSTNPFPNSRTSSHAAYPYTLPSFSATTHTFQSTRYSLHHLRIPQLPIPQITQSADCIPDPSEDRKSVV